MKPALLLTLWCCALAGVALAQDVAEEPTKQPAGPEVTAPSPEVKPAAEAPPAETPEVTPPSPAAKPATEAPSQPETFDARVHRILDDFNQRHQKREAEMASYVKAGNSDPALSRLAAPRKVQVELKDELDREQTSNALAKAYADEAQKIQSAQQALQDLIAKRHQTLNDLSKPASDVDREDLEVAAANLARQPGTEAQVREINRRLAEAERDEKILPGKRSQAQQEVSSSEEELAKLQTLEQSLAKESKAYAEDAASAHENRLALADRLEFLAVSAQAEDVLDQGGKAVAAVQHLSASPEVVETLRSPNPRTKADSPPATAAPTTPSAEEKPADRAAETPKE